MDFYIPCDKFLALCCRWQIRERSYLEKRRPASGCQMQARPWVARRLSRSFGGGKKWKIVGGASAPEERWRATRSGCSLSSAAL